MKKITAKQVMTYVAVLGLLVLLAVYFLVYKAYNDKADTVQASNASLNQRVSELKQFYDNMDTYNGEMELMQNQITAWLDEFPADVKEEDIIVLALDTEKSAYVAYTNVNISEREALRTIPAATAAAAGMEDITQDLIIVQRKTAYVNITDYFNLKNCIRTINESDNRLAITNITYSKNKETEELEGTIEVTFYSVIGTGKEYIPQNLPDYISGLHDLFGSTALPAADENAVQD